MSINRLPKQFQNGVLTANERTKRNPGAQPFDESLANQYQFVQQAADTIRTYPTQTLVVGFLVGAAVAFLTRKSR